MSSEVLVRVLLSLLGALLLASVVFSGCASNQCDFHSQCGTRRYCQNGRCLQQCRQDFDCEPAERCNEIGQCVALGDGQVQQLDAFVPMLDAFVPPSVDGGSRDAFVPPPFDGGARDAFVPPPRDSGPPPPTGRYLDRCTSDATCLTGHCVGDLGSTRMCTIACTQHIECASEHVCAGGLCVRDDTGRPCSAASGCLLGLCVGNSTTGGGQCTRQCSSAAECPAGFACADAGGTRVCVDIERPCSSAAQCATGLCLDLQRGCTAPCRTVADCPAQLGALAGPYTCEVAFGSGTPICVPSSLVVGADPIGASCRLDPGTGGYMCRSQVCDDSAPLGAMCTQACNEEGGCGPGLACYPLPDGGTILLVCERAGSLPIGAFCGSARDCDSGLCDATGSYCTRLCTNDGLCPTGMRCDPVAGFGIAICRR